MSKLASLAKDTAIYGLSSIIGRFLNYLLVPLYTNYISAASGGYGVITNIYGYTAIILVLLTFGMETTFFRFANKDTENARTAYSTTLFFVGGLSLLFFLLVLVLLGPISSAINYADHTEWVWVMALTVAIDATKCIPFDYLRYKNKALKFAALQLLNIILSIGLNIIYFVVMDGSDVSYVFYINLVCTIVVTLALYSEIADAFRGEGKLLDTDMLRRMFSYSWPILVLGIAGILNQTASVIVFPMVYDGPDANMQLGIYGAAIKIAMIMAMITQAFRFAYEPLVFAGAKDKNSKEFYAKAMKYFLIFTLLAFLFVMGYIDLLRYLIGEDYWDGLRVVPIVMVAEIMMGVYFNLSFWYKLIDKTIYGAWFSLAGCAMLFAVNIIFIPIYGYMACAWAGVAGYGTAMVLSYVIGQRQNPIDYPMQSIFYYVLLTAVSYVSMDYVRDNYSQWISLGFNTLVIMFFVSIVIHNDFPLSNLPVIGKYFRK